MYGTVSCEGYIVGKKCRHTCNAGFQISGTRERVCQPDTKWSGTAVKCSRK